MPVFGAASRSSGERKFERIERGAPTGGNASELWHALRARNVADAVERTRPLAAMPGHVILSNEGLYKVRAETMKDFCSALRAMGYRPKCLVLFRPQIEQIVAAFVQHVKSKGANGPTSLSDFALSQDYAERRNWYLCAHRLEDAFGSENLTVKWYPAVVRRGGIQHALFDWLGLTAPDVRMPKINPTPGWEALHTIQVLNQAGLGGRRFLDRLLAAASSQGLLGAKLGLDTETALKVHGATRSSNEMLLRQYCRDLSPEEELKPPPPEMQPALDEALMRQLSELAARLLIEQGAEQTLVRRTLGIRDPAGALT